MEARIEPGLRAGRLGPIGTLSRVQASALDLTWAWTGRTLRARYQQSVLGWLWAFVQPAASIAILTVVFTRFVRVDTGDIPYLLFSSVAVVPWTFLSTSLTDMTDSLVQNMNLITKAAFRRETIPVAAMLARLLDFVVALGLLGFLLLVYDRPVLGASWLALPLVLAVQLSVILGLGLTCASLNVMYRDVRSLLALGVQIWFYASPVIYPIAVVPENLRWWYRLNPMAGILEAYRDVLLRNVWPDSSFLVSVVGAVGLLAVGALLFRRLNREFADVI